jgi:hypothetical protein
MFCGSLPRPFHLTLINRISALTKLFSARKAQKITSNLLKKSPCRHGLFPLYCTQTFQEWMALTGQVSSQAPQSMQVSGSITCLFPCSLMALTGQESSHAPQFVQSSVIVKAMVHLPYKVCLPDGIFKCVARPRINVQQRIWPCSACGLLNKIVLNSG